MNIQRFTGTGAPTEISGALLRAAALNGGELSVAALRALSPFEENAQKVIDQAVVRVGLQRLAIAADVLAAGLRYPLANPLSVMEVQWEQISQTGGAQRTMSPRARGENQLPERRIKRVPVFLTTDDFSAGIRTYLMSQRIGTPIDTTLVESATRRVNEGIEDAMINGGITVDGYSSPGILNAPNANTYTLTVTWATATGAQIFTDVEAMITKLQTDKRYGPYHLFVGTTYSNALDADFKANGDKTIRQRLLEIEPLKKITTADMLPANTVVLLEMSSDVVDMVDGQAPTVIPWRSVDGFQLFWMVMAIMIPRVKDDYDGNSGICVGTP